MSSIEIKEKPIDWFKPDPGNVKLHSETQIEQLMASIERFGFRDPIGCDPEGNVIEGHGRLEAATRRGMKRVPALIITGLSKDEARAYAIAHNQTTMNTGLDATQVRDEFVRLGVSDVDYSALGYTPDDALFLFDTAAAGDGGGSSGGSSGQAGEQVHATTLAFASKAHHEQFTQFLSVLRLRYPDRASIAQRIDAFVAEYGDGL